MQLRHRMQGGVTAVGDQHGQKPARAEKVALQRLRRAGGRVAVMGGEGMDHRQQARQVGRGGGADHRQTSGARARRADARRGGGRCVWDGTTGRACSGATIAGGKGAARCHGGTVACDARRVKRA